MELWRSFFQDSRNRPVDKSGKEFSAPKCAACDGIGKVEYARTEGEPDTKMCQKCEPKAIDEENKPTTIVKSHLEKIIHTGNDYFKLLID